MRLLEHEAKGLLAAQGVVVPRGEIITSATAACPLSFPCVVKVQIPIGGRGKAGGVRVVDDAAAYEAAVADLLGGEIKGFKVATLLIEEKLAIAQEYYVALVLDRTEQSAVLLAHKEGGVEIEKATDFLRIVLPDAPDETIAGQVADYLELTTHTKELARLLHRLWKVFTDDALLVEVNPLVRTKDGRLMAADAKIELDNAAVFRHAEWQFQEKPGSTQFVVLNPKGTVASMANGAGLAMATMDAIAAAGATPANFFDVGGGTSVEGMTAAFMQIHDLPEVKAIVINIFAGITRCDQVAQAVIAAKAALPDLPPLFIRLSGTNEAEGKRLLSAQHIPMLPSLASCVAQAVQEVRHV